MTHGLSHFILITSSILNSFLYFYIVTNFTFRISLYYFLYSAWPYIIKLYFDCAMICIVVFSSYISEFISIHNFWYWTQILLLFKFVIQHQRLFFTYAYRIHFQLFVLNSWFHWSIVKFSPFIYLSNCNTLFLSFKGTTHTYLL